MILVGVNDYGKGTGNDQINRMNNAETWIMASLYMQLFKTEASGHVFLIIFDCTPKKH